jgi:hypothetical protein
VRQADTQDTSAAPQGGSCLGRRNGRNHNCARTQPKSRWNTGVNGQPHGHEEDPTVRGPPNEDAKPPVAVPPGGNDRHDHLVQPRARSNWGLLRRLFQVEQQGHSYRLRCHPKFYGLDPRKLHFPRHRSQSPCSAQFFSASVSTSCAKLTRWTSDQPERPRWASLGVSGRRQSSRRSRRPSRSGSRALSSPPVLREHVRPTRPRGDASPAGARRMVT